MVKSSRTITLDSEIWLKIEDFAKKNNLKISEAIEKLIVKGLEKR
jgi:macrodomain Ter protein organizer (MatP/YcbG family)